MHLHNTLMHTEYISTLSVCSFIAESPLKGILWDCWFHILCFGFLDTITVLYIPCYPCSDWTIYATIWHLVLWYLLLLYFHISYLFLPFRGDLYFYSRLLYISIRVEPVNGTSCCLYFTSFLFTFTFVDIFYCTRSHSITMHFSMDDIEIPISAPRLNGYEPAWGYTFVHSLFSFVRFCHLYFTRLCHFTPRMGILLIPRFIDCQYWLLQRSLMALALLHVLLSFTI